MILNYIIWYYMILNDIKWYYMILYDIKWYYMILYDIIWYYMILNVYFSEIPLVYIFKSHNTSVKPNPFHSFLSENIFYIVVKIVTWTLNKVRIIYLKWKN